VELSPPTRTAVSADHASADNWAHSYMLLRPPENDFLTHWEKVTSWLMQDAGVCVGSRRRWWVGKRMCDESPAQPSCVFVAAILIRSSRRRLWRSGAIFGNDNKEETDAYNRRCYMETRRSHLYIVGLEGRNDGRVEVR
jgi:hypothetical protein